MIPENIAAILQNFKLSGKPSESRPIKTGHINSTFCITCENGEKYTLQAINQFVFKAPRRVMENIVRVTRHLGEKITEAGGDPLRETLSVVPTQTNDCVFVDGEGEYWRCYRYIDNARSYDFAEDLSLLYKAGAGFGRFQRLLADIPMEGLYETIPNFHNTRARMDAFFEAVRRDENNRARDVAQEIAFFERNRPLASKLIDMQMAGELPLRVTHNDTKFNNVLIDDATGQPLCIIDLDTVMPGLAAYDFGDAVRFAASTAEEDERDLSRVALDLDKYEAFARGFTEAAAGFLSEAEMRTLHLGAPIITMELASRFLLDYLEGDRYFRISREGQNLDRARCQIALAEDMLHRIDTMGAITEKTL